MRIINDIIPVFKIPFTLTFRVNFKPLCNIARSMDYL